MTVKEESLIFPRRIPTRYSIPGGEKSKRVYIVAITVIISVAILSMSFESGPAFASPAIPVHHQTPWNYVIPIWLNKTVMLTASYPWMWNSSTAFVAIWNYTGHYPGNFIQCFIKGQNLRITLVIDFGRLPNMVVYIPLSERPFRVTVYVSVMFIHVVGNSTYSVGGF